MKIKFVGVKPDMTDYLYGTNIHWPEQGSIQDVADPAAAAKMLQHPDVWERAADEPQSEKQSEKDADDEQPEGEPAPFAAIEGEPFKVFDVEGQIEVDLEPKDDAELKLWARTHKLKLNYKLRGENLLAAVVASALGAKE